MDSSDTLRDTAGRLFGTAGESVRGLAEEGKAQVNATLDGLVIAAHEFADRLGPDTASPVARTTRAAAAALGDWSKTLQAKSVDEIVDDGRDLIRKSPAVAVGGAVVIGFLLSRLLKASTPANSQARLSAPQDRT